MPFNRSFAVAGGLQRFGWLPFTDVTMATPHDGNTEEGSRFGALRICAALGCSLYVLGKEHPDMLMSAYNLPSASRSKYAGCGGGMLQAALEVCQRVLGNAHPQTLHAQWLEYVRSNIRAAEAAEQDRRQGCGAAQRAHGRTGSLTDGASRDGSEGERGGGGREISRTPRRGGMFFSQ